MKKYLLSMVALILAVTFSAFTTPPAASKTSKKTTAPLNWFQTSPAGLIQSSNPVFVSQEKADVIASGDCDNTSTQHCLYGTTAATMPVNQDVSDSDPNQLIRRTEQ